MRIENSGIQSLSTKPAETATPIERREEANETESVRTGQDKVEMSENARLLAKARTAMNSAEEIESERVALLKKQVDSGDYTIQIGELARKLLAKIKPK